MHWWHASLFFLLQKTSLTQTILYLDFSFYFLLNVLILHKRYLFFMFSFLRLCFTIYKYKFSDAINTNFVKNLFITEDELKILLRAYILIIKSITRS